VTLLLERVGRRDREAFSLLYRATSAKLYGVISRILSRGAAADEVLQDVYVKIWDRAGTFDPSIASPITWMATIARNRALDEIRRAKSAPLETMSDDIDVAADTLDPLAARERSEDLEKLLHCLGQLDEEKKQIILLAYYRGMSREALSARFKHPVSTIKTWLHRSLTQLRGCLSS
jgi:RNA polymerase sigma-70 factor (ECF subfamily)